jgi:hypothetical protein
MDVAMRLTLTNIIFCPGFTGQQLAMIHDATDGKWKGDTTISGKNFHFDVWCPIGGTKPTDWLCNRTDDCGGFGLMATEGSSSCSPFAINFFDTMGIGVCPTICAGPVRQFRATFEFP